MDGKQDVDWALVSLKWSASRCQGLHFEGSLRRVAPRAVPLSPIPLTLASLLPLPTSYCWWKSLFPQVAQSLPSAAFPLLSIFIHLSEKLFSLLLTSWR